MVKQRCAQWDGFCGPVRAKGLCSRHYMKDWQKAGYRGPVDGRKLRKIRTRFGSLQGDSTIQAADLARYLGVDPSTVAAWEKGTAPVPEKYVERIAARLFVTPEDLALDSS